MLQHRRHINSGRGLVLEFGSMEMENIPPYRWKTSISFIKHC